METKKCSVEALLLLFVEWSISEQTFQVLLQVLRL